ncbi:MAG TPA: phosphoribosylglycinamide synthetase C domain-containing protein, partial [Limnochordia bacterium]
TGGMGAFSPVPDVSAAVLDEIEARIATPIVRALAERGTPYRGFLFAGLMLTDAGPQVIEFNCRFGDPEAQVLFARWQGDLVAAIEAAMAGEVSRAELAWDTRPAVCVVLASGGYPGPYRTGLPIDGLDAAQAEPDTLIFHAGTRLEGDRIVTAGGRVLSVVGRGESLAQAARRAYAAAAQIHWDGVFYRRDIAAAAR